MLRGVDVPVSVHDAVRSGGSRTATRVPYSRALQIHLLPVAERIAAFRAACAGRVEMMVVTGLQDLAADVTIAVGALHPELLLVILLAVRHAVSVGARI